MQMTRILARSFAGGEIAPEMAGRLDLDKFQTGLATCRNFLVLPHGPAMSRGGFLFVNEAKDSANAVRIIPFAYNDEQTYIIELGHNCIRFHTNGATLLEAAKNVVSITQANPGVVEITGHGWSNGDWVFAAGIGGMTALNGRFYKVAGAAADTFTLQALDGSAISTAALPAFTAGGTFARVYTLASPYAAADLFNIKLTQSADVLTLTHPTYPPKELRRLGPTNWQLTDAAFAPTLAAPGGVSAVASTGSGSTTYTYKVTAVSSDGVDESYPSSLASCTNNLATAGNKNTITWSAVSGASRYNVYKLRNGLYGYIGQTSALTFDDDNIGADVLRTPPEGTSPFPGAGDYPGAVGYFSQRRLFGGTNNRQGNGWFTRPGTEGNMTSSVPTQDDDAIFFRLVSGKQGRILHFAALDDLLILTASAVWRLVTQNSDALTPGTFEFKPQAYVGANNVRPILTADSVLFIAAKGAHMREVQFAWERNKYAANDISIMAPHLFTKRTVVDMDYQTAPYQMAWVVRDDGILLGLTYVPEHKVIGWHRHDTEGGYFESVAVVAENNEDVVYAVVRRTINGRTVRYIERLSNRDVNESDVANCFCVDSGLTYSGASATVISNLWHLEGQEVAILADGAVQPRQTVTNGQITLAQAASKVHVGKAITADLQILPLTVEAATAYGRGALKNLNRAYLRVVQSSGIFAGPALGKLKEFRQRTNEPYGSPPALRSGEIEIALSPQWQRDGGCFVRQVDPVPVTISALVLEAAVAA